jgi:hypothetical protein
MKSLFKHRLFFAMIILAVNSFRAGPFAVLNAQAITLGPIELVYTAKEIPVYYDHSFATVKKSDTEFFFWATNGGGKPAHFKYYGTPDNPLKTQVWAKSHHELIDYGNYPYPSTFFWLGNFYKINQTEYINFAHFERYEPMGPPWIENNCKFGIALLFSSDAGNSWKLCGEIIAPYNDIHTNVGGTPYIIVGEYFYCYFNENTTSPSPGSRRSIAVARAKVADVIAAARKNTVTSWTKYYNGNWSQNALTGQASPLNPGGSPADAHGDAHYNTSIGKYILTCNHSRGLGMQLHTSTDGINWEGNTIISDSTGGGVYSWHCGFGGTDDCRELSSEFYIYWRIYSKGIDMWRRKASITMTTSR